MRTTFSGARLDRAGERRSDAAWVAARLADPASRALAVARSGVWLDAADEHRVARFALAELHGERVLLGLEDGDALFAVDVGDATPADRPAVDVREAAALLDGGEAALVAQAAALTNWHRAHPRCSRCGAPTDSTDAGYIRRCPNCGAQHHPRTDPVVIMIVADGSRLLLGRQPTWPPRRYSALAGFVEPGESLEEAVAREVREEADVEVTDVRYVASQPWPFPASLMLGFAATYAGGTPSVRDHELEDVRWFERAELEAAVAGEGDVLLPPPLAIARNLVDGWLAGDI